MIFSIGLIAAVHFLAFISSLYFTTVAHCRTLIYTAPLFIAALSRAILGERLPRRALVGIMLGLIGVAVLAGFEPHLIRRRLVRDLLALAAGLVFALYSLLGRRERARIPLLPYPSWVYLTAGVARLPFALGFPSPARSKAAPSPPSSAWRCSPPPSATPCTMPPCGASIPASRTSSPHKR